MDTKNSLRSEIEEIVWDIRMNPLTKGHTDLLLALFKSKMLEIVGEDDEPGLSNDPYGNGDIIKQELRQKIEEI